MYYGTRVPEQQAFGLLDRFAGAGGGWLDTADCYSFWSDPSGVGGASERVLGSWLRSNPGAPVTVATKVRYDPLVPHRWPGSATGLSAAFPEAYDHPGTTRALLVLDEVVAETGATRNQVVLAWLLSSGIRPIVGASRLEQLDEALGAAEVQLTPEQLARFAAAR
jgi:aryl-alcohol dehydrogenase-like predicted oxidoreductase